MQETDNAILSPSRYDWTGFTNQHYGFQRQWCRDHTHKDGSQFNFRTVNILINGHYDSKAGPKITEIIKAALAEGLIVPFEELDQAA